MVTLKINWKKGSWVILFVFLVPMILDFVSTWINPIAQYLEVNTLYLAWGKWWPIIISNALALYIFLKAYGSKKIYNRFMALNSIAWFTVLRVSVIINNFKILGRVHDGEITESAAAAVTTAEKVAAMTDFYYVYIILGVLMPIVITNIIYWFMLIDHKVEEK